MADRIVTRKPMPDFIAMYAKALRQADQFARHTNSCYYRRAAIQFARRGNSNADAH